MDFVEWEPAGTDVGGDSPTKPVEVSRGVFAKPLCWQLSFAGMEGFVMLYPFLPWPMIFFLTNAGVRADKRQCFPYSYMGIFPA